MLRLMSKRILGSTGSTLPTTMVSFIPGRSNPTSGSQPTGLAKAPSISPTGSSEGTGCGA